MSSRARTRFQLPAPARRPLLASCAIAAIAIAAPYAPARAQGFQGTGAVVGGTTVGTITTPSPTQTTITINTSTNPRAIINWTPTDTATGGGAVDFLPTGNTALFEGNSNAVTDFTILNRILPTDNSRPVALNGNVISRTSNDGGTFGRGNIWFYSPGGLIVGANAQFLVGSLLLSANNITDANFLGSGPYSFASAANSTAAIEISAGAQLAAAGPNSYVALIAPRVRQAGTVQVAGSAAYVAAEKVDLTINGTLFNISFPADGGTSVTGTGSGTAALEHTGTTTLETGYGYTSTPQRAIMVAVPKNDAVTMLVSGGFNYQVASGASVVDHKIILSGGKDIVGGEIGATSIGPADVKIVDASFTSSATDPLNDVVGEATGAITAIAQNANLVFSGSAFLKGGTEASVTTNAGRSASVQGDLLLDARAQGSSTDGNLINATGGTAKIDAQGTTFTVGGSTTLVADGLGGEVANVGGEGRGGTVQFSVANGSSFQTDSLSLTANGQGGGGGLFVGTGRGGTVDIDIDGQLTTGGLTASANGAGGLFDTGYGEAPSSGLGIGGAINLDISGSIISGSTIDLTADGTGYATNCECSSLTGGSGVGGTINISLFGAINGADDTPGTIFAEANGTGGDGIDSETSAGQDGGNGFGGNVSLTIGGDADLGDVSLLAAGTGGRGGDGQTGGAGGEGIGGTVQFNVIGGDSQIGNIFFVAEGAGGNGGSTFSTDGTGAGGSGGRGIGGTARLDLFAGSVQASEGSSARLTSEGIGGNGGYDEQGYGSAGGSGGAATGGNSIVTISSGSASFNQLLIDAEANGGYGGYSPSVSDATLGIGGQGGDAQGGTATLQVGTDGSPANLTATSSIELTAGGHSGIGGDGNTGGAGGVSAGGAAGILLVAGQLQSNFVSADARAFGAEGGSSYGAGILEGAGGSATGGAAFLAGSDGTVLNLGELDLDSSGFGGNGGQGGAGTGGTTSLTTGKESTTSLGNEIDLYSEGYGGDGDTGYGIPIAGDGTGGAIIVSLSGDVDIAGNLYLSADGNGGDSYAYQGATIGNGFGGNVDFTVTDGQLSVGTDEAGYGSFTITAGGFAGYSGEGGYGAEVTYGSGNGGSISLNVTPTGSIATNFSALLYANGVGFDGCTSCSYVDPGGTGSGGTVTVNLSGAVTDLDGGSNAVLRILAQGIGGSGGAGLGGQASNNGGDGIGGTIQVTVGGDDPVRPSLDLDASGFGGDGGFEESYGNFDAASFSGGDGGITTFSSTPFTGAGGDGVGGSITISAVGENATAPSVNAVARGVGGRGSDGTDLFDESGAANGGNGGRGNGGIVRFEATNGGQLTIGSASIDVTGTGGDGGFGADAGYGTNAVKAGNGGTGGDGTGGSIILATDNGQLFFDQGLSFSSNGYGGEGGNGGYNSNYTVITPTDAQGNPLPSFNGGDFSGGDGGYGGVGSGGTISIDIKGGFVSAPPSSEGGTLPNLTLSATGYGGEGGFNGGSDSSQGTSFLGSPGPAAGGTINISVADKLLEDGTVVAGVGNFGFTQIQSSAVPGSIPFCCASGQAGTVTISNTASAPDGGLSFAGLDVTVDGYPYNSGTQLSVTSSAGPIKVDGDAYFSISGNAEFTGIGDGGLAATGDVQVYAYIIGVSQQSATEDAATIKGNNVYLSGDSVSGDSGILLADTDIGINVSLASSIGKATAGDDIIVRSYDTFAAGTLATTGDSNGFTFIDDGSYQTASASSIVVNASNGVTVDSADAAGDIRFEAGYGAIGAGDLTAGRDILLSSRDAIDVASALAGDDIEATSAGAISFASATTTGLGEDTSESGYGEGGYGEGGYGEGDGSNIRLTGAGAIRLDDGNAVNLVQLSSDTDSVFSAGTITAESLEVTTALNIALNDLVIANGIDLTAAGGLISGNDFTTPGSISAFAANDITIAGLNANGDIDLTSQNAGVSVGQDITTDGSLRISAATGISLGTITTGVDIRLDSSGGDIDVASATAGDDIEANSETGSVTFASATTTGLGEDIGESGYGAGDGSNVRLIGAGAIRLDDGSAVNLVQLSSDTDSVFSAGTITAESLEVTTALNIALNDLAITSGIDLAAAGGTISGNDFTTPGSLTALASGEISINSLNANGDIDLTSQTAGVSVGEDISTAGSLSIDAAADIALGNLDTGDGISLTSDGDISLGTARTIGDFLADAGGSFTADTIVTTAGNLDLPSGRIVAQAVDPNGNGVSVAAADAIAIDTIDADGSVILASTGGPVTVATDLVSGGSVDASGTEVTLNALGGLNVNSAVASAGSVTITTGGALGLQNASATDSVNAETAGLLTIGGTISGPRIFLTSRDISVGANAQVGTITPAGGTQRILVTANGTSVQLGGAQGNSGYTLDNAEFSRFTTQDLDFAALDDEGSLTIGTLTIRGGAGSAPNVTRALSIGASGPVSVTGAVAFQNTAGQNALSIQSGGLLFVDLAGGGISLLNAATGALAGSLDLEGSTILVSTTGARNDVQNAADIAARNARLGQNDGQVNNNGVIRAGSIRLAARNAVWVQNTGGSATPDDRAGLFAGDGGITLVDLTQGTPLEVIINGRQQNGATLVTGASLIDELTLEAGYGTFAATAGSTVNGCPIGGTGCGEEPPPPPPPPFVATGEVTTSIGDVADNVAGNEETLPPQVVLNDLIRIERTILAPIIDEPVTGSGNDDYYVGTFLLPGDDDDDRDGSPNDQQVTGTGNDNLVNQPGTPQQQGVQQPNDQQVTGTGNDNLVNQPRQ